MSRITHTFIDLPSSPQALQELRGKLEEAGYGHLVDETGRLHMTGIALVEDPDFAEVVQPAPGFTPDKRLERLSPLCAAVAKAAAEQRDAIGDSDLYDEQPVTLTVSMTLGDARTARAEAHLASEEPSNG